MQQVDVKLKRNKIKMVILNLQFLFQSTTSSFVSIANQIL